MLLDIVGYIGPRQAAPILLKGLKRLEFRCYDSAGLAIINSANQLAVYKTKGKDTSGTMGIVHTRLLSSDTRFNKVTLKLYMY
jgi:glucosamine--fructose-6-phosphate aminotransferase (isomerizing)